MTLNRHVASPLIGLPKRSQMPATRASRCLPRYQGWRCDSMI